MKPTPDPTGMPRPGKPSLYLLETEPGRAAFEAAKRHPELAGNRSPDWAFMQRFEIPTFDEPLENYLTRLRIIQTPWFGIYLHRIDTPDSRPTLHDHPWSFLAIVLRGGYQERVPAVGPERDTAQHTVRRFNFKRATDLHFISRLLRAPTWTLVLTGRRKRVWGYRDHNGWTRFDEHPHNDVFNAAMEARKAVKR